MGAVASTPDAIRAWAHEFRSQSAGPFQVNTWIPDPPPDRQPEAEARVRSFLALWGPDVPASAGEAMPPDFASVRETFLQLRPPVVSSIMGV